MKVKSESEVAQSCQTLSDPIDCSLPGSSHPRDFPGKSTEVGCQASGLQKKKKPACFLKRLKSKFLSMGGKNTELSKPTLIFCT